MYLRDRAQKHQMGKLLRKGEDKRIFTFFYIQAKIDAPESVIIKSKKDLKEKLQKGLNDIKANRVYSLDEVFTKIDNI